MSDLGRELINQMILVIFVEEVWVTGVLRSHPDWEEEDPAVSSSQGGQAGRRRPFYGRDPDGPVGGCPWAGSLLRLLTHRESPHSCSWLPGHACFELLLQRPSDERHKPALFSDPWCSSEGLWWKGPHSHTPSILALPSLWTLEENLFFWPLLSQLHWFVVFPLFFFFFIPFQLALLVWLVLWTKITYSPIHLWIGAWALEWHRYEVQSSLRCCISQDGLGSAIVIIPNLSGLNPKGFISLLCVMSIVGWLGAVLQITFRDLDGRHSHHLVHHWYGNKRKGTWQITHFL